MDINGKHISNWVIIGGVAGVGVVYYLYKKSSNSSAASTASTNTGANSIDPVTGLPYSEDNTVDPLTGMTYLAEAQEYGSVSAAESAMSQNLYSAGTAYDAAANGYVGSAGYPTMNVTGDTTSSGSYATNAAWSQAVTAGLTGLGYNAQDVAAALGLFFAQQPLGSGSDGVSYSEIVKAAEAEYGPPPQGTYSIIPEPSSGGTGGTTTTGSATTVNRYPAPSGVTARPTSKTSLTVAWHQTNPPADSFTVAVYQLNGAKAYQGTVSVPDTTGGGGTAAVSGLTPGFQYKVEVWANGGKVAPPGTTVTVTMPKN